MTKKEKAILKLAQKWANLKARHQYVGAVEWKRVNITRAHGRALLKILEP